MPVNRLAFDQIGGWKTTSSYLTGGDVSGFVPSKGLSFACWIKPHVMNAAGGFTGYLASLHDSSSIGPCWRLDCTANTGVVSLVLREQLAGGPQIIKALPIGVNNAWNFIGGSLSANGTSGTFNTYVNASPLGSTALTLRDALPATPQIRVGHAMAGGNIFPGVFHRMYIFNRILTDAEFSALYYLGDQYLQANPSLYADLIGWYKFGEFTTSAVSILDYSPKSNNLTPSSTHQWVIDTPFQPQMITPTGINALKVNGTTQYAISTAGQESQLQALIDGKTSLSIASWIRQDTQSTLAAQKVALITNSAGTEHVTVDITANFQRGVFKSVTGDSAKVIASAFRDSPYFPTYKNWNLMYSGVNFAAGTTELGFNGLKNNRTAQTFNQAFITLDANPRLAVATRPPSAGFLQGRVGPTYFFNRELTTTEFRRLYLYGEVPANSIIAQYMLLDSGASQLTDSGPNGLHLPLNAFSASQWTTFH